MFDTIIIGGSYSGLSAALTLGRSLRKVLVIDSNDPCNKQTPHSHNFITQDGSKPAEIAQTAKKQVLSYSTVTWKNEVAKSCSYQDHKFRILLASGETVESKKLLIASGVKDEFPSIDGFSECWGISVLHCPYCHGYEVSGKKLGLLGNGELAGEFVRLIQNWSKDLVLFTNGPADFNEEQQKLIEAFQVRVVENSIQALNHQNGYLKSLSLEGNQSESVDALFARVPTTQKFQPSKTFNLSYTDTGHIQIDEFNRTNFYGLYAAGDCTTPMRSVAMAVASGNKAGTAINMELIEEEVKELV